MALTKQTGKVVKVLSETKVVVDIGSDHGLKDGADLVVYELDEEIIDPETNESLGRLEIVRGKGKARHVQPKFSTVEACSTRLQRRTPMPYGLSFMQQEVVEEVESVEYFDKAAVGDLVRVTANRA